MGSSTSSSDRSRVLAPEEPVPEDAVSRRLHLAWLARLAAFTAVLLVAAGVAGTWALVRPVFDPDHFVLPETTRTLVVGASHAATNIDPAALESAVNVGRNGEPVFFTYYKLQAVLARNPWIEHVVYALSVNHVSCSQDALVFAGDARTRESFMAYFPFVDRAGRRWLDRWSEDYLLASAKHDLGLPLGYMDDLRLLLALWRGQVDLGSYPCWGGFEPVPDRAHVEPAVIDEKVRFYFYDGDRPGAPSRLAMEHVLETVELCERHGVRLTFVSTPLHERFRAAVPASVTRAFEDLMAQVRARHPEVGWIDASRRYAGEPVFFDGDHLGRRGTVRFSRELARSLRQDG